MFKLSFLLGLLLISVIYGQQYGVQTAYSSSGCTGTPIAYMSYILNTCIPLGNPVNYLIITTNATTSTTKFYADSSCSGVVLNTIYTSITCTSQSGLYISTSVSTSLPTVPFSNAYNSSAYLSSTCSGAPFTNSVWSPAYCFTANTKGVNYLCNSTHTTTRTYTGVSCDGAFTDASQLISAGCQSNVTNTCANTVVATTSSITSTGSSNNATTTSTSTSSSSTSTSTSSSTGSTSTSTTSAAGFIAPLYALMLIIAAVFYL